MVETSGWSAGIGLRKGEGEGACHFVCCDCAYTVLR